MSIKKNINEISASSAAQGSAGNFFRTRRKRSSGNATAPFKTPEEKIVYGAENTNNSMYVLPIGKKNKKGKIPKKLGKLAKLETKSESMLRESIRNLIFLNKVKYHEEQALREMQEQKLRNVIRFLLESDNAVAKNLDTTGQTSAYKWLQKIEKTTFENSFVSLVTSRRQRRAFKKVYLTGVKIYLDALDQKYFILNPGKQNNAAPAGQPQVNPVAAAGMATGPLAEQEVHPAAEPVAKSIQSSNDSMQDQAITSAISSAGFGNLEKMEDYEDIRSAVNIAKECLKQDLAQLDDLYFDLSLTNFTTQKRRQTNDRKDFRLFLIGEKGLDGTKGSIGNLQINFNKYNKASPITNNFPNDIPPEDEDDDVPQLDVPSAGQGDSSPAPELPPEATTPTAQPQSNPFASDHLAANNKAWSDEDEQAYDANERERQMINRGAR